MHARCYQTHFSDAGAIDMIEVCDDWYVRVLDRKGRQTVETFDSEDQAIEFAEHELQRLGLDAVHRL